MATHVDKEAFITALSDNNLELEVMKREPATVEMALSHAIKVEAYEQSLLLQIRGQQRQCCSPQVHGRTAGGT